MTDKMQEQIKKEAIFGIAPCSKKERTLSFLDAFLVLSGYGIATWCYTQGAYVATSISFKQLLISMIPAHCVLLALYLLPIIMATRYGIDTWIWFRSIFGTTGYKIVSVVILIINFPWYAVCADLFAGAIMNMLSGFGFVLPEGLRMYLSLLCVAMGTFLALRGPGTITKVTRVMVPLLLAVGIFVLVLSFTSVPLDKLIHFVPPDASPQNYVLSIEGNMAFAVTWCGTIAVTARICKTERGAYWGTCLSFAGVTPLFVLIGGVMAVAMFIRTGSYCSDPTLMLATLGGPVAALLSLILVAFANVGTQGVGSYLYAVMLKGTFPKVNYKWHVIILAVYASIFCIWGNMLENFGKFLTITALIYAPVNAILVVDFFFLRKQKLSLRSAYELGGHHAYRYFKGFNFVGLGCVVIGALIPLLIYDPFTGEIKSGLFLYTTGTGLGFVSTGILYYLLTKIPKVRSYMLQDRDELTVK